MNIKNKILTIVSLFSYLSLFLLLFTSEPVLAQMTGTAKETHSSLSDRFVAIGVTGPTRIVGGRELWNKIGHPPVAVRVYFDLLPTRIDFRLPSYPVLITENGIGYCNNYAETYDPYATTSPDAGTFWRVSFELNFDRENRYARIWIKDQSDARIVVREKGALVDNEYTIAHTDTSKSSPYGKGDWADEWYYIYPDGFHSRHIKVYTALAMEAYPFGFDRQPPDVIFEVQESNTQWRNRSEQQKDIYLDRAITLIRMNGESQDISYLPYPDNFGDFQDANICVVNYKSQYRPVTITRPDGVWNQPLQRYEVDVETNPIGYALGHILCYKFYKRTNDSFEQIYLQGWTKESDPSEELVSLAKSWVNPPQVDVTQGSGITSEGYDKTQRAFVFNCTGKPSKVKSKVKASKDSPVVNPALLFKNWGQDAIKLKLNGKDLKEGKDLRVGFENDKDLVIWLKHESVKPVQILVTRIKG